MFLITENEGIMIRLKSIFMAGLTGICLTSVLTPTVAFAGNSFKEFSNEAKEVTNTDKSAQIIPSNSNNNKKSLPEFLSETYVSGVYSDGCGTFKAKTSADVNSSKQIVSSNTISITSRYIADLAEQTDVKKFSTFGEVKRERIAIFVPSNAANAPSNSTTAASANTQQQKSAIFMTAAVQGNGFGGSRAETDSSLSETRGASLQVVADTIGAAILTANAVGNNSTNSTTGANSISGDAFGSASGVVSLIQNSGNNVIIQTATVVNLKLQ
jgi:hypothetical protein